jgi:hypothetical protein
MRQRGEDGYTVPHACEIGWDEDGLFFVEPGCPRVTPEEYGDGVEWMPCIPPEIGPYTRTAGFIPTTADRITLGRIHDAAPSLHVGDLAQRLVKRILSVACSVQSNECAIRGMCTNKCGALNHCEVNPATDT